MLGSSDVGLSAEGCRQAETLAFKLPRDIPFVCSPMLRVKQTLNCLQKHGVGRTAEFDARLREVDFGHWEMKSFAELKATDDELAAWGRYHGFCFPGGEAVDDFIARVASALSDLQKKGEKEIFVLAHGGVIRTMICLALNLEPRNYLLFQVDYCSWSVLEMHSSGGVLLALNRIFFSEA